MNILTMALSCIGVLALVFMTGCGNGCGQVPKCNTITYEDVDISYTSIPMCGGCLTSGWGCTSCLWGENCICSDISHTTSAEENYSSITCIEVYYGNMCLGCGSDGFVAYNGVLTGDRLGEPFVLCYNGGTVVDEHVCGCGNGGCVNSDNDGILGNVILYITGIAQDAA